MQTVTQYKSVQTYKSFSLVGKEAKKPLPTGEQKAYPDTMGLSCLIIDNYEDYTYQTKRRCI